MLAQAIDISFAQGDFDLGPAIAAGVETVIVKATSGQNGSLFTDSQFHANAQKVLAAGLNLGFYHFNGSVDAGESARYFWQVIQPYYRPGMPTALDIEPGDLQTPEWGAVFFSTLIPLTPEPNPWLYCDQTRVQPSGWQASKDLGVRLWIAAPDDDAPSTGVWDTWDIRQYGYCSAYPYPIDGDECKPGYLIATPPPAPPSNSKVNNVALPLIVQQAVQNDDQYGLNIVVWDTGFYYWIDGEQRDVWLATGAEFLDCTIPGRFEYIVSDADKRQSLLKGLSTTAAEAGAAEAYANLIAAAKAQNAPLLSIPQPSNITA